MMKTDRRTRALLASVVTLAAAAPVLAAAPDQPLTQSGYIAGGIKADFQTQRPENRDGDYPVKGVADTFAVDLAVGLTKYTGTVKCLPHVFSKHLGRVLQDGGCAFDLDLAVMNPQDTSQQRKIGKLVGNYAVDDKGQVNLGAGNLRIEVQTMGKAQGFTSPFSGSFSGKPPRKVTTLSQLAETAQQQVRTIEKMVDGRKVAVSLGEVDPLRFSGTVLAMGPVASYPQTAVEGEMIYSYETDNWFPQLTLRTGSGEPDRLGGGMKWVDDSPGVGHYELNLIFNEALAGGEAAAFEEAQGIEAFFATDSAQSAIVGRIDFRDQTVGEAVVQSDIRFDVGLQNVTPIQAQSFAKLILLLPEQLWGE